MGVVTCGGCGLKFDRSVDGSEFIKGKWYHKNCARIKKDKIVLDEYICKIFTLKALGPVNNKMIKDFVEKRGYTYDGILKSLKYYYEIKKHPTDKAEERVGIVPFVYDDAQNYYNTIDSLVNSKARTASKKQHEEITINLHPTKENKNNQTKAIDNELDSLFDEE